MNAIVHPACLPDALDLQRNCYPGEPISNGRDYLTWCLSQARRGWIARLVAEVEGEIVGHVQLTARGGVGEIGSLIVAPAHRRRGLARRLVAAAIEAGQERGLEAVEIDFAGDQPFLGDFYVGMGFEKRKELSLDLSSRRLMRLRKKL